jgi:L-alanine-DL-glutamate epimerase-like enolase superfamily enzyme
MNWSLEELHLPLRFSWTISRNSSDEKINFYVKLISQKNNINIAGIGEVAPNVRYGESPELIKEQFNKLDFNILIQQVSGNQIASLNFFNEWLASQQVCNSLRFGIESAFIHFYCQWQEISVYELLKIQPPVPEAITAFSLPIMDIQAMKKFYNDFGLSRFKIIKVKIGQENALETIATVASLTDKPLLIDANEAWTNPDALLQFFEALQKYNIAFIEQPMPAAMETEYAYLKGKTPFLIFADESVTDHADFEKLSKQFDGVNMKLMKAGGYQNGLRILQETRKYGLKTMIGCMVETSLGISSALKLSHGVDFLDLDSFLYLQKDPSHLIHEENGLLSLI